MLVTPARAAYTYISSFFLQLSRRRQSPEPHRAVNYDLRYNLSITKKESQLRLTFPFPVWGNCTK